MPSDRSRERPRAARLVMGRARPAVAVTIILAIAAGGIALWRQSVTGDARTRVEQREQASRRTLATTEATLARTRELLGATEQVVAANTSDRDALRLLADTLQVGIRWARDDADAAAVEAWTAGGRASELARCLAGVEQALNQLAVGDGGALRTLATVAEPCRAAGA